MDSNLASANHAGTEPVYHIVDGHKIRKYDIKTIPLPRLHFQDPEGSRLISEQQPVLLTGTKLTESALKWDLEYLKENFKDGENSVFISNTDKFMYYDEKRCIGKYAKFKLLTQKRTMCFSEFHELMNTWKPGDERIYLQQMLTNNVKEKFIADFLGFNWKWLAEQQIKNNWGPLTSNLLLIGLPGNITPVHYDEQENFFAQVRGLKRCILFPPSQFKCLYPFPYHHPCDRQSQVDFDFPDYDKFPLFKMAVGREVIVEPGDVLYIPVYWWHYIESVADEGETISVNFWCKSASNSAKDDVLPLNMSQKVAVMRNIEKLLGEALDDSDEVSSILNTIVNGRYPPNKRYLEDLEV